MKLIEDYKNKLNNLKKENLDLNKNNILINENNEKLKTNIKLNTDEIEQLKNQIEKELMPKINNYEAQINLLTKENKAKEKIINQNSSRNDKMNLNINKNLEEIKNLKNENEQNNREIQDLNKEINLLKIKLLDKEKEVTKLKEEIKNMNDDNSNQKDEFSNEINILNKKLSNQQSSNNDYIKKIEELNSKVKKLQNDSNDLTQKNTQLLNEILSYKEINQKLKIENDSQQKTLAKLTSLSKDDNESKKNALIQVKELNKKITEYLLMINSKENEIKKLKDENFKNKNEIKDLSDQLKNKSNIESQIDELKKQQNQATNINSETNTKLNLLSLNCDEIGNVFNKFQPEIESIQTMLNSNKNNNKNIDLTNLNQLIDEENEDIDANDISIVSSTLSSFSKKENEKKRLNLNNSRNRKLLENMKNKTMELCMNNINQKVNEAKSKFLSLMNSYYNSLTHINKKIKEKEKIHNSINDLSNTLIKSVLPNLENFDKITTHYEKKIGKSKTDDEVVFYLNKLINDIINKLKDTTKNQKSEIDRLHDRVEYFIGQCANMKKTQEILAEEERNSHKIQKEKYESQIKKKEEELIKMKKKINENEVDIDEGKRKNENLYDEILEWKDKYNIQKKDIENIDNKAKEQRTKNEMKALNTAKYAFKDFFGKVRNFADVLYIYSDMKPDK